MAGKPTRAVKQNLGMRERPDPAGSRVVLPVSQHPPTVWRTSGS
jgi:hypothetical protein